MKTPSSIPADAPLNLPALPAPEDSLMRIMKHYDGVRQTVKNKVIKLPKALPNPVAKLKPKLTDLTLDNTSGMV